MRFIEKVAVSVVRPVYRAFFEKPLWWFLAKLKVFFLTEIYARLDNIEQRLREDRQTIAERLQRAEEGDKAQWDALEQLLLSMFHQPHLRVVARNEESDMAPSTASSVTRTHAASNIR